VVTLTVTEGNEHAIALYESLGFKRFGVEPLAIAVQDGFKAKVHMWREIPPAPALGGAA
jgi:ribosomal protein S18 acetylase RimI-like enzyme